MVQRVVRHLQGYGLRDVKDFVHVKEDVHFAVPPELRTPRPLTQISVLR